MQPETLAFTVEDPMIAAVLRLAAASGILITGATLDRGDDGATGLVISAKIDARPIKAEPLVEIPAAAPLVLDAAGFLGEPLPAEPDANFRPRPARDAEPAAPMTESELQLAIVARLEVENDRAAASVARSLLRPLASRGWAVDGDREAVLRRVATDFADYRNSHLAKAANLLTKGKHSSFPEHREIYAALGRAARPGTGEIVGEAA